MREALRSSIALSVRFSCTEIDLLVCPVRTDSRTARSFGVILRMRTLKSCRNSMGSWSAGLECIESRDGISTNRNAIPKEFK
jgi:hypothetical protein